MLATRRHPGEHRLVDGGRDRDQDLKGAVLGQALGGVEHRREDPLDLAHAAAGKQRERPQPGLQPERPARLGTAPQRRRLLQQRVAHVGRGDAALAQEGLLEGIDAQHLVHARRDLARPARSPGPHHRAHVVDDADAGAPQPLREPQVEVRQIHEQGRGRAALDGEPGQPAQRAQDARQPRQHLGEAHHRNLGGVVLRLDSGAAHVLAAHAEELRPGAAGADRAYHPRRVQVAGGFAGDDEERGLGAGHAAIPSTVILACLAAATSSSRSTRMVAPASTASTRAFASASAATVPGPMAGRSKRRS